LINELQIDAALTFVCEALGNSGIGSLHSEYEAVQTLAISGVPSFIQALRMQLPVYCAKRCGGSPALKQTGTVVLDMSSTRRNACRALTLPRLKAGDSQATYAPTGCVST